MTFAEKLETILKEKAISKAKILSDLKLGKNQFNYWKTNGTVPNGFTVQAIAEYLDISVDYLLGKTDIKEKVAFNPQASSSPLPDILYRFSDLSDDKQKEVIAFMEFKLAQQSAEQAE